MPTLVYPPNLPGPESAPLVPDARALRSDAPGVFRERNFAKDFTGKQTLSFFLDPVQAAAFYLFWNEDLLQGGRWFSATWPFSGGNATLARRFSGEMSWAHLGGGAYRVTVESEFRGLGLAPEIDTSAWEIAKNEIWKYRTESTPGIHDTAYSSALFNDSSWLSGPSPIGSGSVVYLSSWPVVATEIGYHPEHWMRLHKYVPSTAPIALEVMQDDNGAELWINGVPVALTYLELWRSAATVVLPVGLSVWALKVSNTAGESTGAVYAVYA